MRRLANSPICDIRKVSGTSQAASYVAKYIGKAPARFGRSRAYWYSRTYPPPHRERDDEQPQQRLWFRVTVVSWRETLAAFERTRPVIDVTSDGWYSIDPAYRYGITLWLYERFAPIFATRHRSPLGAETSDG